MRALITGGAGFVGSHLAEKLLALGHDVTILDDLSTGSAENICHLKSHVAFEYHLDTIFNRQLLAELVDLADVVFHLAAAVGVRRIVEYPVRTIKTNVGGSELVLELAAKKQKRVLITSTSEVYGKSTKLPFSERDDLVFGSTYNSRWSYACSKAIDEFLALAYYREKKLPVTIVRLFNTAGPRQTGQYGMVLPTFVRQALSGEALTVFGTGDQSRCFGHVHDVVEGMVACVTSTKTVGEIFNLGNTEQISITALATKIIAATGSKSLIRYVPYSQAYGEGFEDMEHRIPDLSKAHNCFGYTPKRSLDEIIAAVIQHMQQQKAPSGVVFSHVA
ncbi:MAG TPA: GDP-mannose 4,6-dehydratase [Terriglobales bacterium]|jgi:UDP-glucose 4-epimerase|nr:GDP-mannose 4,6-dehydratase [Terriglobales bacterium]